MPTTSPRNWCAYSKNAPDRSHSMSRSKRNATVPALNSEIALTRRSGKLPNSGLKKMRLLKVMVCCALLAACGISRQADQQEAADTTLNDINDAITECRHANPDEMVQAVARAVCMNKAVEPLRALLQFPDLLDQEIAMRKSLAEQVQARKMSLIDRMGQIAEFHKKMLAEEQSRVQANNPSVPAQETAAAALWRTSNPTSCAKLGGNSQYCY